MVRARDGSLVRRIQRGVVRAKPATKVGQLDAETSSPPEAAATTQAILRSVVARADCPDQVRRAIEQSITVDIKEGDPSAPDRVAAALPIEPAAGIRALTVPGAIADSLLEAVSAADDVSSPDKLQPEPSMVDAGLVEQSSETAPRDPAATHASDDSHRPARSATRRKTARSSSNSSSVFSRLQPVIDPKVMQLVQEDLEAKKNAKQQRERPKPTSKPVDSTFVERMSSIDSIGSRSSGRGSRAANAGSSDGVHTQVASSRIDSDAFIGLMSGAQPQPQPQPQQAKDRREPTVVRPSTAHTILRSPFYEVTHNASLGLAGGKPGEGPQNVEETDIIKHGGRVLRACLTVDQPCPQSTQSRMIRFADCGIFSADQLAHTLATRTTPGFHIPQTCMVRGRSVLLSELLITCCSGCTISNPFETHVELVQLYTRLLDDSNTNTIPRGAPLASSPMPWVSPPLALALFTVQRLDLQETLVRINVTSPQAFLQLADLDRQAEQTTGEESVLDLPINVRLRESGHRMLTTADIENIRKKLVPPQIMRTSALDGCLLVGSEDVNWSVVPPLVSKGVRRSLRDIHEDSQLGDVCYIPGQIPLAIGLQTGSHHGGNVDTATWTDQGNARCPRVVQLLENARGGIGLKEGTRIVSEKGDVRGTLTSDTSVEATELRYVLDESSRRDFARGDWVFESTKYRWEKIRQGDEPIAFWRIASQPQLDDQADRVDKEQSIIALAEALAERFVDTLGGIPHIVLCRLDLDKVVCANPLSAATQGLKGSALQRARTAWQNYHALVEVAKLRMTSTRAVPHKKRSKGSGMRRAGCGLFVELHPMPLDAPAVHGPLQLGYGLVPYEVRCCTTGKQPTGSRIDSAAVTRAFNVFDRDGSGAIDRAEFSLAVSALDLDMTEEDITEVMNDIDADGSGEIDKREFKRWFAEGQDAAGGGGKIAEIRARSMLGNSLISGLAKRLRHLAPSTALVGDAALGSLLERYGLTTAPSCENSMPFRGGDYQPGRYSVQAHRTPSIDAVEITLPPWMFRASSEQLKARAEEAFATFDVDGSGDIDADELRLLARKLRLKLDEEQAMAAVAEMTGDVESQVVTKEQFTKWYSQSSAPSSSDGTGSGGSGLSAGDVAQRLHVRRSAARLADGLASFLTLNYGFTTLPGSGARRGPPRLLGNMFTRTIKVNSVKIKSDGTLIGGN